LTTQRLEAFSDGVFAVAITILAFDVHLPGLGAEVTNEGLYRALLALAPKLYSYAVSFVLVGMFWVAHHNIFAIIQRTDRPLQWLNLVVLLWVCLLPFSATTLGSYPALRTAVVFYGLNLLLIGQSLFWLWRYACYRELIRANVDAAFLKLVNTRILLGTPLYLVGIAAAYWNPQVASTIYVLAVAMYIKPSKLDHHFGRRGGED
jgi:uncharacterized membrane protein